MVGRAPYASATIGGAMNTLGFRVRLGVLGLSVRRFAAMTGVHYETEMMEPAMSRKPPDETLRRPRLGSDVV
jgi:hypothetical protein